MANINIFPWDNALRDAYIEPKQKQPEVINEYLKENSELYNEVAEKSSDVLDQISSGLNAVGNTFAKMGASLLNFGGFVKNYWKVLLIAAVALIVIKR